MPDESDQEVGEHTNSVEVLEKPLKEVATEVLRDRTVVLITAVVDALLLAALSGIFLVLHHAIGDINKYSLIDKIVIICYQLIAAFGMIGPMLLYMARDIKVIARRTWKS